MKKVLAIILAVLLLVFAAGAVYVNIYEAPTAQAVAATQLMESDQQALWLAGQTGRGYLLYPGGKVDERAYAPLAHKLHEQGDTVVIARMPLRLAILDVNRAERLMAQFPEVTHWVLVGHSLGGTAAAMYLADHPQAAEGIVFLASYPSQDLSSYLGGALSLRGSLDGVLNLDAYQKAEGLFPDGYEEIVLEGGNHSGFGDYGLQGGDTPATISGAEQQQVTAWEILNRFSQSESL